MKRSMALDVGTKTIGVAVSDPLGMFAQPLLTIRRVGVAKDSVAIQEIIDEKQVQHVVVGLPLELDGTETRSARLARQIGNAVGELSGLQVTYIDERFTSVEAERQLISVGMKRKKRKQVIDQQAAVLILQAFLDGGGIDGGGQAMGE